MPITVERMGKEPIILMTVKGHLTVEIARDAYARIAEIASTIEGPIFRITDVREQETTFVEMLAVIQEASSGREGTTADPRIKNVFVGDNKFAAMERDAFQNRGILKEPMPMFLTMDEALTSVRWQLKLATSEGQP